MDVSATPERFNRKGNLKSSYRYTGGGPSGGGRVPTFTVEKSQLAPKMATFGGTRKGKGATIKRISRSK